MGWDRGRYYTRSKKVKGRVVREYIGTGPVAELVAQMDILRRQQEADKKASREAIQEELNALDAHLDELNNLAELVAQAVLVAAGYHQHKRGEWRRQRVRPNENC